MTAAAEAMAVMAGGTAAAAPRMGILPAGTVRIEEALAMEDVPARI